MPSHIHERPLAEVEDAITHAVLDLATNLCASPWLTRSRATLARHLENVYKGRSGPVELEYLRNDESIPICERRYPDASFYREISLVTHL